MPKLKGQPDWLRVTLPGSSVGVDRETRTIRGFLVAEEGPFRSQGRGEFDRQSIDTIRELMASVPAGLKSRFSHPTLSDDGLGKFLGRATHPRIVDVVREGQHRAAIRADLHLSETAFEGNPNGNLGDYVMDLAEEDGDALGASLVLTTDQEFRLDEKGRRLKGDDGEDLPPLWRPKRLHAVDVVDTGDATRAFLGLDGDLPDSVVRAGSMLLDEQFPNAEPDVIRTRCMGWLDKYLALRFPDWALAVPNGGDPDLVRRLLENRRRCT